MFVTAVAAVLALLATAELLARRWIRVRGEYYVMPPGLRLRVEPDRKVVPQLESVARFHVNSDGERGDDLPRRRVGLHRVLVVGGSQAEGLLLDQDSSWSGALQRILAEPGHLRSLGASRVHVGCVARSGVGSEALALILRRILPRYRRLNTIVVLVGASDVMRWLEEGAPPRPSTRLAVSELFRWHPEERFTWRLKGSGLFELARRFRRRWLRPTTVQANAGRWMAHARDMRARASVRVAMPNPEPMLDHFDRCFRTVLDLASAHADRVIVVPQPWFEAGPRTDTSQLWNGTVGTAWKQEITECFSVEVLGRLMHLLDARTVSVAAERDVELVDIMAILPSTMENYYDFIHLTPRGAAVIARGVADAILHRGKAQGVAVDIDGRLRRLG